MASSIVVVGVASLYMSVGVPGFPVEHAPGVPPAWLRSGVAGSAAHVAKVLSALGNDVRLCTLAGSDPAGLAVRADLRAAGLPADGIVDAGATSLGVVLVSPDGSRMGYPYLAAVNAVGYPAGTFRHLAAGTSLAVLTNTRFAGPLLGHARDLSVPIAVDVHLIADVDDVYNRPWLEVADIVFCSHERLPCPPAEWAARMFARYPGCEIVGIGQGAEGAILGLRDGTLVRASAVAPRGVVSTTGAGDALFASFLHGWLATGSPVQALSSAVLHAGWKIGCPLPGDASLSENELARLGTQCQVRTEIGRWDDGGSA
ncbi:MAG TPA: carbohydrate kinase family protein [Trebonia sp.]|jgi:sugar/nucleoside kinase (ribokinase family)|nr:carbohydrate kinase family protein [Trebonia sp.]